MSTDYNNATVRRYFEEALDRRTLDVLDETVAIDCVIHRAEAQEPIRGLMAFKQGLEKILQVYSEFSTTIHDLIAEDDSVARRLSHRAVNRGQWTSRLGRHDVAGSRSTGGLLLFSDFTMGRLLKNGFAGMNSGC